MLTGPAPRCPHCDGHLRPWQIGNVTLDGCDECGGCWFDAGELQALSKTPGEALEAAEAAFTRGLGGDAGGGLGRCPKCGETLASRHFERAREIAVRACSGCHGIWLDDGALRVLAAKVPQPRHPLLPRVDPQVAGVAGLAGVLRTVRCPRCDAINPDLERRCAECGADLLDLPSPDQVRSRHPLRLGSIVVELLMLLAIPVLLLLPGRHGRAAFATSVAPAAPWLPILVALLIWAGRWLFKTWRYDVTSGGLVQYRLWGRRRIPWDSIHGVTVWDLGVRSVFSGWIIGRRRIGLADLLTDNWHTEETYSVIGAPARVQLVGMTSRGVFAVGPDLTDHVALIDAIREHLPGR
ncbi:MAG: zf-TFIIB domain-containing protein [Fimbriimonadaceae bacterium]|nr:zf-TFIIB domain-containing protein [Fimbriimonadaceae bacterium]